MFSGGIHFVVPDTIYLDLSDHVTEFLRHFGTNVKSLPPPKLKVMVADGCKELNHPPISFPGFWQRHLCTLVPSSNYLHIHYCWVFPLLLKSEIDPKLFCFRI